MSYLIFRQSHVCCAHCVQGLKTTFMLHIKVYNILNINISQLPFYLEIAFTCGRRQIIYNLKYIGALYYY